ncbi:MAG: hypothetical protein ACJ72E_17175 [Marmoricola sp.]
MSFFGIGAAAGASTLSVGAMVAAGVGGAVAAGAIAVATTQVAANMTQPDATSSNLHNVNSPGYDAQ